MQMLYCLIPTNLICGNHSACHVNVRHGRSIRRGFISCRSQISIDFQARVDYPILYDYVHTTPGHF